MDKYIAGLLLVGAFSTGCASSSYQATESEKRSSRRSEVSSETSATPNACEYFWRALNAIYVTTDGGTNRAFKEWAHPAKPGERSAQDRVTYAMREFPATSALDLAFVTADQTLPAALELLANAQLLEIVKRFGSGANGLDEQGLKKCFEKFGSREMNNKYNHMDSHAGWIAWASFLYAANKTLPMNIREKREWYLLNQAVLIGALNDAYIGYRATKPPPHSCLVFKDVPVPPNSISARKYSESRQTIELLLSDFLALAREYSSDSRCPL